MMRKLSLSIGVMAIFAITIFLGVHWYFQLEEVAVEHLLPMRPGQKITVDIGKFLKGRIAESDLVELSDMGVVITRQSVGQFTVEIPKNYRGITASLDLSGKNLLNKKHIELTIKTPFIGKVAHVSGNFPTFCQQDDMGIFCWGSLGVSEIHPPNGVTANGVLTGAINQFCSLEDNRLLCWGAHKIVEQDATADTRVAMSDGNLCVANNGKLKCWGSREIHSRIPTADNIQKVVTGLNHACILADHAVRCWGSNFSEEDEITKSFYFPMDVAAGTLFSCALDGGRVFCWGPGSPMLNMPELDEVTAIQAAGTDLCALSNRIWHCWNEQEFLGTFPEKLGFVLGRGGYCLTDKSTCHSWYKGKQFFFPNAVQNPRNIQASDNKICFQTDDGIVCNQQLNETIRNIQALRDFSFYWDDFCTVTDGIACNGRLANIELPSALTAPEKIVSTANNVCALQKGKVYCWGSDQAISQVPVMEDVRDIAIAPNASRPSFPGNWACATHSKGVSCWGDNPMAEVSLPKMENPTRIVANQYGACAIDGKTIKCWGIKKEERILTQMGGEELIGPVDIAIMFGGAVCAIDHGRLLCGQERISDMVKNLPIPVSRPSEIAASHQNLCVIDDNGVTCLGNQYFRYARK